MSDKKNIISHNLSDKGMKKGLENISYIVNEKEHNDGDVGFLPFR